MEHPEPLDAPRQLRVLTFNVRMLPYFSAPERAYRIAEAIKTERPAYDVVCLQEVFCDRARRILEAQLRADFPYIDEPVGGDRWRFNSGLFTASRLRPVSRSFETYGLGGIFGGDFLAEKGAVALELELDGSNRHTRLCLFHTHLQSLGVYRRTRRQQLTRLSSFIHDVMGERAQNGGVATLLMGDLNVAGDLGSSSQSEYDELMETLGRPRDLFREANPSDPGLTHPSTRPSQRLDYVLAFDRLRVRDSTLPMRRWTVAKARVNPHSGEATRLSDHLAVEADLRLEGDA